MLDEPALDTAALRRRLVARLEAKRRELGLGHVAFSADMGVDRTVWFRLRRGDMTVSWAMLERLADRYPDVLASPAPPEPQDEDVPARAAFATYLLTLSETAGPLAPADLKRWWDVWRAAWRAARRGDADR